MAVAPEAGWWIRRRKNTSVTGTWLEDVFQASLRSPEVEEDPLAVKTFSEMLPYHCIPQCGVYGFEDYLMALPHALLHLQSASLVECREESALFAALPSSIRNLLQKKAPDNPEHLDIFISIHSTPDFKSGVEPDAREVNIVYHLWVFQSVEMVGNQAHYLQETVEMGLYQPYNITEVGQDVCEGSEQLDGISVNRLGPRIVEIHGSAFSPRNAQIGLLEGHKVHAFYSCGCTDSGNMVIVYHIVTSSEDVDTGMAKAVKESVTVGDLLDKMVLLCCEYEELQEPFQEISKLLEASSNGL